MTTSDGRAVPGDRANSGFEHAAAEDDRPVPVGLATCSNVGESRKTAGAPGARPPARRPITVARGDAQLRLEWKGTRAQSLA